MYSVWLVLPTHRILYTYFHNIRYVYKYVNYKIIHKYDHSTSSFVWNSSQWRHNIRSVPFSAKAKSFLRFTVKRLPLGESLHQCNNVYIKCTKLHTYCCTQSHNVNRPVLDITFSHSAQLMLSVASVININTWNTQHS